MSSKNNFCAIVFLFVIFYMLIGIMPVLADEDNWDNLTVTLGYENSIVSKDGYTLEALKFDGYGMVLLQVSKNGIILGETALENNSSGWCYMDNNNIRLKACNVTDQASLPMFGSLCSPEAEIIFETKRPVEDNATLDLDLEANKEKYLLDDEVIVNIELRNTGNVGINKVKLDVDSDGLLTQKGDSGNLTLNKGSKNSCKFQFKFPAKIKEQYNITAKASWEDNSGKHSLSKTVEIEVAEPLQIYKNTGSEAFSGSSVPITVSVENVQDREVTVSLLDLLPASFSLINKSDSSGLSLDTPSYLSQEFVLAPEEKKTFSYSIRSNQLGAHRVPQTHAYANLCGQHYTEISDSENIITVCKNISYKKHRNESMTEVMLSSGSDLSDYLDKNGYALLDIIVENKTLDASVFIPKGTKLLDSQKEPIKAITIAKANRPPLLTGMLLLVGPCYRLQPEGAELDPFVNFSLGLNKSIEGNFPCIYRYDEKDSSWTLVDSTFSTGKISAEISGFSVYTVLAEPLNEVKLHVNLMPSSSAKKLKLHVNLIPSSSAKN